MPMWPLEAESLVVNDGVYQLHIVPTSSISLVSNRVVKASLILEQLLFLQLMVY